MEREKENEKKSIVVLIIDIRENSPFGEKIKKTIPKNSCVRQIKWIGNKRNLDKQIENINKKIVDKNKKTREIIRETIIVVCDYRSQEWTKGPVPSAWEIYYQDIRKLKPDQDIIFFITSRFYDASKTHPQRESEIVAGIKIVTVSQSKFFPVFQDVIYEKSDYLAYKKCLKGKDVITPKTRAEKVNETHNKQQTQKNEKVIKADFFNNKSNQQEFTKKEIITNN